jgi:hypothetical protein
LPTDTDASSPCNERRRLSRPSGSTGGHPVPEQKFAYLEESGEAPGELLQRSALGPCPGNLRPNLNEFRPLGTVADRGGEAVQATENRIQGRNTVAQPCISGRLGMEQGDQNQTSCDEPN